MTAIRVGINLLWLRPGEVGGSETYIRRILRALAMTSPTIELNLFGSRQAIDAVEPIDASTMRWEAPERFTSPVRRVALERTWLRRRVPDGLHVMHHPGGTLPFTSRAPSVVTVHDLQPLDQQRNFSLAKRAFLSRSIPTAVRRADVIVTPSDWVRDQICERFSIDEDRVITVSAFAARRPGDAEVEPSTAIRKIFDRGPVAFYPAMTMRHKNHAMLFEAFALASQDRPDLQLVCIGAVGRDDFEIRRQAAASSPRIHMLGHVDKCDLDALFKWAEMLVFPSRYEGFGLPVLEAQHVGLPVIASTSCALPEVAGNGATLLDADDREAWATAMAVPLVGAERAAAVAAGERNVLRYTIETTATQQRSAYDVATS